MENSKLDDTNEAVEDEAQRPRAAVVDPTLQGALERHRRLAAGMHSLSELFLKARVVVQRALESDVLMKECPQLGVTATRYDAPGQAGGAPAAAPAAVATADGLGPTNVVHVTISEREPGPSCTTPGLTGTPDQNGDRLRHDARAEAQAPVVVCSRGITLNLVLAALEAQEKPPLSFALGVLGWDLQQTPDFGDKPNELVDLQLVLAGRRCLAEQCAKLLRGAGLVAEHTNGDVCQVASMLELRIDLPLGSLRFTDGPVMDWEAWCGALPLDRCFRWQSSQTALQSAATAARESSRSDQQLEQSETSPKAPLSPQRSADGRQAKRGLDETHVFPMTDTAALAPEKQQRSARRYRSSQGAASSPHKSAPKQAVETLRKRGRSSASPVAAADPNHDESTRSAHQSEVPELVHKAFPSSDEHASWRETARVWLNELLHDPTWEPFWAPVSKEEVPDYYEYIRKPMDLTTMRQRLESGQYPSLEKFMEDANLVWRNAVSYNRPRSAVWHTAKQFKKVVATQLASMKESALTQTTRKARSAHSLRTHAVQQGPPGSGASGGIHHQNMPRKFRGDRHPSTVEAEAPALSSSPVHGERRPRSARKSSATQADPEPAAPTGTTARPEAGTRKRSPDTSRMERHTMATRQDRRLRKR
jgi:hypothetical protein